MSGDSTIVLITGANSGVGYAATKVILNASASYHVILAGRSSQKINDAAAEIKTGGIKGTISTLVLDVTDEDSIAKAAREVEQQFGRLDVLINNAGVASKNPNLKKQMEETLLTNVVGPAIVTDGFKSLVVKGETPRVIHVTSGLGSLGMATDTSSPYYSAGYTVYRLSKSALNMFMVENTKDLGKQGVKVFALCPGLVKSNLRGTGEQEVNAGGRAGDPDVSGNTILSIIEGRRDADVGKVVHKDGTYPW